MILNEIERAVICGKQEYRTNADFIDAIEAAVLTKLSQGVSVEPVAWMANSGTGTTVTPDERMNKDYYNIPLYTATAIAAARVQALEDAAEVCAAQNPTGSVNQEWMQERCADAIRALKGGAA